MHQKSQPFQCKYCVFYCNEETNLKLHVASHNGEKSYQCPDCKIDFSSEIHLKQHMVYHKGDQPVKHKENYIFDFNAQLNQYKMNHKSKTANGKTGSNGASLIEQESFACQYCDQRFVSQAICMKHMQTHETKIGDKSFLCNVCENKFPTLDDLKVHMLTHNCKTPFACSICEFVCKDKDVLVQHMDLHTGDWSLPFLNGKPIRPNAAHKPKPVIDRKTPSSRDKRQAIIGTGKGSDHAVQRKKYHASLFATRFKPSVETNTVKKELEINLLKLTGTKHIVTVEKIKTRFEHYASFKISCACDNADVFNTPELWPERIFVRWWRSPRNDYDARNKHINSDRL